MAGDCLTYWKNHSTLISCFGDMRPFLETLHSNNGLGGKMHFFRTLATDALSKTVCFLVLLFLGTSENLWAIPCYFFA